jgi:hypothetical protein
MYVPMVIALMLVFPLISIVATGILTDHSALGAPLESGHHRKVVCILGARRALEPGGPSANHPTALHG